MKIIDNIWFSSFMGIVGVVIGEDENTDKRKAYVGIASGVSIEHDIQIIVLNGCPLSPEIAAKIANLLNPPNNSDASSNE